MISLCCVVLCLFVIKVIWNGVKFEMLYTYAESRHTRERISMIKWKFTLLIPIFIQMKICTENIQLGYGHLIGHKPQLNTNRNSLIFICSQFALHFTAHPIAWKHWIITVCLNTDRPSCSSFEIKTISIGIQPVRMKMNITFRSAAVDNILECEWYAQDVIKNIKS